MSSQPAPLEPDQLLERPWRLSRRHWLAAVAVGPLGLSAWPKPALARQADQDSTEAEEIAQVEALAKKAGLGPFIQLHSQKRQFLGMGDAPKEFCEAALGICESLAAAFVPYFQAQGFKLALPKRAMTVITLKDKSSYQAWSGDDPGAIVGGHYDLRTNRLVMFDFRPERDELGANPEFINRMALVHETTHLLSFNTGLLSRKADVPDWVSEGLAIYVELWRPTKPKKQIGSAHDLWLPFLRTAKRPNARWIPIHDLIANDKAIWDPNTQQLAYAESWLLVHYLMKKEPKKFRAYLAAINDSKVDEHEKDDSERIELFESVVGPTKTVTTHVDSYLKQLR
jgi:hypothetical protein